MFNFFKKKIMKINPNEFKSVLKDIKDLKERNKAFDLLDDAAMAREIAFDAFELTLLNKIDGEGCGYWNHRLKDIYFWSETAEEFQYKLNNKFPEASCSVCARGAIMLSMIRLGNKIKPTNSDCYQGNPSIIRGLKMQDMINAEKEFEGFERIWLWHPYRNNTTEKLQNILLNIIANGRFDELDTTDYLILYHE